MVHLHHGSVKLRFDCRFVHQHDGNVVLHSIDAATLCALQGFWILAIFERLLAGGANEDFEQVFGEHTRNIVRRTLADGITNRWLAVLAGHEGELQQSQVRKLILKIRVCVGCGF
jgi:hypothetical protein